MVLMAALAVERFDRLANTEQASRRQLVANGLVHAGLVMVHMFGFVYSGMVLVAMMLWDLRLRRFLKRLWVYASVLLGWLVFLPWLPAFLRQADVSNPHFWIPVPELEHLFMCFPLTIDVMWVVVLIAVAILLGSLGRREPATTTGSPVPLLLVGVLFVPAVTTFAWVFSQLFVSVFLDRYMLPGIIGWAIFFAAFAGSALDARLEPGAARVATWWRVSRQVLMLAMVVLLAQWPLKEAIQAHPHARPGQAELAGHEGLFVVCESPHWYLPRHHYQPDRNYLFVLDWEAALQRGNALNSTVDYKLMSAMKRHFPQHRIVESKRFLEANDRFLLLDEDARRWSEMRIEHNREYRTRRLRGNLFLVERRIGGHPQE
jgi:4-amino-4-deoxy-L-arabinose transferase-like glycosyltransferase